ncbi:hypothetical protein [Candidatus Profftia sp. (ex Adelges kitamiensis)]|nr:hypothetical protein [Candidatus Profftia sp. (ex Adelges kitamiensis)]
MVIIILFNYPELGHQITQLLLLVIVLLLDILFFLRTHNLGRDIFYPPIM